MKKSFVILILSVLGSIINAQVGINTNNPKATLQVQKRTELAFADGIIPPRISGDSLRLKEAAYGPAQNGAMVFVTSPITTTAGSVKTRDVTTSGFFVYDANYVNPGGVTGTWNHVVMGDTATPNTSATYAMRAQGNLQLLSLGINLLGSSVRSIPIRPATAGVISVEIGTPQVTYNSTTQDGYYVVPSTGLYHIDYSFRTGQGVRAELLTGSRPGLIITKANSPTGTQTALDYRLFGGVQLLDLGALGLVNVSITQGQISHIYNFQAGDVLRFGIVQGGLALSVLSDTSAELSIYKIR